MRESILEFKERLDNILLEATNVSSEEVTDAINNRYRVIISYDDETKQHKTGSRLIEPYVYGLSQASNEVIRAFQYYGDTRRGIPKYKMFRLDRIKSWNPQPSNHFYADPKRLVMAAPDYNNEGDESMSMIFAQVHFDRKGKRNETEPNQQGKWQSPLERVKQEKERQKSDIDKQINNQPDREGAVKTKSLDKELDSEKNGMERKLDDKLDVDNSMQGNTRGAVKINAYTYDRDNKSPQERHDAEVMRKRDKRWQQAADTRPLYRKSSPNNDLRKDLNSALNINDEE